MASGGQGDVLSGILGGLLAQGIPPEKALPFGVYVHGLAADRLVQRDGPRPVVAGDIIEELSQTLGDIGAAAELDKAREVV
jgi:NAD(P)H-hydrate epimerase